MTASRHRLGRAAALLTKAYRNHRHTPLSGCDPGICDKANPRSARERPQIAATSRAQPSAEDMPGQGALDNIDILTTNPFLWAVAHLKYRYEEGRGRLREENVEGGYEIEVLVPSPGTAIHTAREAKSYDRSQRSTSDEKNARIIAANLYARYHFTYQHHLERFVIANWINEKPEKKKMAMNKLIDASNQYQCAMMKFYYADVERAIQKMSELPYEKVSKRMNDYMPLQNSSINTH